MVGVNGISGSNAVGYYFDGSTYHGFLYNGAGYTTLDPPGSALSFAADISGNNTVGAFDNGSGTLQGFLYNGSGYIILNVPGSTSAMANGVSGNNVFGAYTDTSGRTHAFLYDGTGYSPLDPPGSIFSFSSGGFTSPAFVSVVGWYQDSSGTTHGFLATPIPEPSSLSLLAVATMGLIIRRSGRRKESGRCCATRSSQIGDSQSRRPT